MNVDNFKLSIELDNFVKTDCEPLVKSSSNEIYVLIFGNNCSPITEMFLNSILRNVSKSLITISIEVLQLSDSHYILNI